MAVSNPDGNLEIHPGPRGYSVVSAGLSTDGKSLRLTTDEPRTLNPVLLPVGPRGDQGPSGDPGEARIRVDDTVGRRVYLWDVRTVSEQFVYGDTGTWTLADGTTTVRRVNNTVETNATDPTTLPDGFKPAVTGATGHYLTAQPWPAGVTGTVTTQPTALSGLEGYQAAAANGYPGTAEEWVNLVYRVVLPPAGSTGQVLTRTASGSAWVTPQSYGPKAWQNVTLDATWQPVEGSTAQVRESSGTVELHGLIQYVGPTVTAGAFSGSFVRVGVMPPAYAPVHAFDIPITSYRASDNEPSPARLIVNTQGVISIGAFALGSGPAAFTLKATVAQANLSAVSYALRGSSTTA